MLSNRVRAVGARKIASAPQAREIFEKLLFLQLAAAVAASSTVPMSESMRD